MHMQQARKHIGKGSRVLEPPGLSLTAFQKLVIPPLSARSTEFRAQIVAGAFQWQAFTMYSLI